MWNILNYRKTIEGKKKGVKDLKKNKKKLYGEVESFKKHKV